MRQAIKNPLHKISTRFLFKEVTFFLRMSSKKQYNRQISTPAVNSTCYIDASSGDGSVPQLVSFVKQNGIGPLIQDYNIQVKYHRTYKNLLLFKYDQISSPWDVSAADREFFSHYCFR